MAMSNMLRRGLNLIPSVASTARNGFTRALSFTGSFNDQTSLLLAARPVPEQLQEPTPPSPSQSQEAPVAPASTRGTFDIEAATPSPTETLAGDEQQGEETTAQDAAEAKRVAKTVQTICVFAASASIVLFVSLPGKPGDTGFDAAVVEAEKHAGGAILYIADLAFICLGLFTSLGLSMYSIVAKSGADDPAMARVQKRAMVMAVAFVLVSFTLRMCMMIPPRLLEWAWLVFILLAGAVAVYLALACRFGGRPTAGEVASRSSSAGAGTADRV